MKPKHNKVFLEHILEEIYFIIKETQDLSFDRFMKDEVLKRACARSLEIIGEAVKNMSAEFKKAHKEVDWKKIAGQRDKIIHHYFGVNWDIVWDVIDNKIPELKINIEKIIKDLKNK